FEQALLEFRLARLPGAAAEPVEHGFGSFGAIARQEFDVLDRQIESALAGIVDLEAVVRRSGGLDRLQADEAANAMIGMDDNVAGRKRRRFGDEVGSPLALLRPAHEAIA